MTWAGKRRLIIISILVACFSLFVALPVAVINYQPPSCTDGKQNQNERGVDCGGPCALQCRSDVSPIKIDWVKLFETRPGTYYAIASVENPNFNTGTSKLPYTVRVYDANGTKILERSGQTFALPNERFYVFEGNLQTGDQVPAKVEMTFSKVVDWIKTAAELPAMSITNRTLENSDTRPKLVATLSNDSGDTIRDVSVTTMIYDAKGNQIAGSATLVDKVPPGQTAPITFTWSQGFVYGAEYESCSQPVDVMLALDRSGSMASDKKSPPQPLTQAKDAAEEFVSKMTGSDQVGYVSFATKVSQPIDQELTKNFSAVRNSISETEIGKDGVQYTNIGDALLSARNEFLSQRKNKEARQVIVLLTDGAPTYPKDPANPNYPEEYTRQVAQALKQDGVGIYTIGLGDEVNEKLLKEIASTPEQYYAAATGAELSKVYQDVATAICKRAPSVIEIIPRINNVPQPI